MLLLGQLFPEHWDYSAVCHHRHSRLCHDVWWMHLLTWQGMCWKQWSSGICNIRFVHQKLRDVRFSIVKCKLTYHMLWPAQSPTFTNTLHPSNSLFSSTTWLSWYQKGKTSLDLNEARGDGVSGCSGISWTICKQSAPRSRQRTTPTPHHSILQVECSS